MEAFFLWSGVLAWIAIALFVIGWAMGLNSVELKR